MVDRRCQRDSKQEVISLETSYQRRVADKQAAINVWAVMLLLLLLRQRVTQDSGQQIDLIGESRQPPGRHRRLSIISWPTLRSAEINASSGPPAARSFVRSFSVPSRGSLLAITTRKPPVTHSVRRSPLSKMLRLHRQIVRSATAPYCRYLQTYCLDVAWNGMMKPDHGDFISWRSLV